MVVARPFRSLTWGWSGREIRFSSESFESPGNLILSKISTVFPAAQPGVRLGQRHDSKLDPEGFEVEPAESVLKE